MVCANNYGGQQACVSKCIEGEEGTDGSDAEDGTDDGSSDGSDGTEEPGPALSCGDARACSAACEGNEASPCSDDCDSRTDEEGGDLLFDVDSCAAQFECEDDDCMTLNCQAALDACEADTIE